MGTNGSDSGSSNKALLPPRDYEPTLSVNEQEKINEVSEYLKELLIKDIENFKKLAEIGKDKRTEYLQKLFEYQNGSCQMVPPLNSIYEECKKENIQGPIKQSEQFHVKIEKKTEDNYCVEVSFEEKKAKIDIDKQAFSKLYEIKKISKQIDEEWAENDKAYENMQKEKQEAKPITTQYNTQQNTLNNFDSIVGTITKFHFEKGKNDWRVVGGERKSSTDKTWTKDFTLESENKKGEKKEYLASVKKENDGGCLFRVSKIDNQKDEEGVIREICRIAIQGAVPGSRFNLNDADPAKEKLIAKVLKEEIAKFKNQSQANKDKFPEKADSYIDRKHKSTLKNKNS